MTTSFTVIIPSRYGSTRLPAKALLDIGGKPLVQRAWESASASAAQHVYIATDHKLIADRCKEFGAHVCLTSEEHKSGTDRIAEVVDQLGLADDSVIVNVQGDQCDLPWQLVNQVAEMLLRHPERGMATVCEPFASEAEARNPDNVKVTFNATGRALSFSREYVPVPDRAPAWGYRHVGLYAYRVGFLRKFAKMPPSPSEFRERLEQLRALDNGCPIFVEVACAPAGGEVNTPADLERVATSSMDMNTTLRGR